MPRSVQQIGSSSETSRARTLAVMARVPTPTHPPPGRRAAPPRAAAVSDAASGGATPAELELILRYVQDAVFATDVDNVVTFWGDSAERLFEWARADAIGHAFEDLLPSKVAISSSGMSPMATVAGGQTWRGQGSVLLPSGRELWLESTVSPVRIDGRVIGSVSISRDMSATHVADAEALALRETVEERARLIAALNEYGRLANAIHDEDRLHETTVSSVASLMRADLVWLAVVDPESGRYFVRAACGLDGEAIGSEIRAGEGIVGRVLVSRRMVIMDSLARIDYAPAITASIGPDALAAAGVPLVHDDEVLGVIAVARPAGSRAGFAAVEREALLLFGSQAALAVANTRLFVEVSKLAVHDGLTGLYNRRHFDTSLELLLARWRRDKDQTVPIAAILFDLDHFGRLNRDYGHQAGDSVLRAFGGILHERLRSTDLVARYGGEEFVAVLYGSTLAEATLVAEEVREALRSRPVPGPDGVALQATVSAGCAALDVTEPTAHALLRAADVGLFMAKRQGRNRVVAT